jgi:GNAT superfamily N-acetyltransferase
MGAAPRFCYHMKENAEVDIQIRQAESGDAPAIAELLRTLGYFAHINAEHPQITEERVARHLMMCAADDSHSVFVACISQEDVIGYIAIHWLPYLLLTGPEGYVSELFIRESHRGQGVGSQLLKVAKTEADKLGCSRLMLINLRSRESYQRQFYAKQGWEEREEAVNFIYRLSS